jgi:hypothetical protein
VAPTLR